MTDLTAIPASMVEAAAKVIWSRTTGLDVSDWDNCCTNPDDWHDQVRPLLAAALADCEIIERWGYRSMWSEVPEDERRNYTHPPDADVDSWCALEGKTFAESMVANASRIPRQLIHRLLFTTPAEVVPAGETT